jgi:hypothetical protein
VGLDLSRELQTAPEPLYEQQKSSLGRKRHDRSLASKSTHRDTNIKLVHSIAVIRAFRSLRGTKQEVCCRYCQILLARNISISSGWVSNPLQDQVRISQAMRKVTPNAPSSQAWQFVSFFLALGVFLLIHHTSICY